MKAGLKLDALMATEVMEWVKGLAPNAIWGFRGAWVDSKTKGVRAEMDWSPSTDIKAAMDVIRRLQELGFIVRLSSPNHDSSWGARGDWECAFWKRIDTRTGEGDPNMDAPFQHSKEVIGKAIAEALPLAICLAAPKAKGIDIEE